MLTALVVLPALLHLMGGRAKKPVQTVTTLPIRKAA
jgi:hypothetical protein